MNKFQFSAALGAALLFINSLFALDAVPQLEAQAAFLMDFSTGRVLYEKEADLVIPPASMTKLVTLYLGLDYVANGGDINEKVPITATGSAFSRPPFSSLMLLEEGQNVTLLEILKGLAISSGNDAAYALAEHISGTPEVFIQSMNELVSSMGFDKMSFVDPDGWSELNTVTPRQYAGFAARYIETFPEALELIHSQEYFSYPKPENMPLEGARITNTREKKNTNILLGRVEGVDGLKTGYIDESGFNFTATAQRGISRYIAVVMGINSEDYLEGLNIRAKEAEALLEYGFKNYKTIEPDLPQFEPIKLWEGAADLVDIEARGEPLFTLSVDEMTGFKREISIPEDLTAPLVNGEQIGTVSYLVDGIELESFPVVTTGEAQKGNIFKVLWHRIYRFFNP